MKNLFIIMSLLCIHATGMAQTATPKFSCTTGEMSQKQYDLHPERLAAKAQLDSFTAVYTQQQHSQASQRGAGTTYVIPVVFHIVQYGGSENLPDSLIFVEMQHWNEYMSMTNPELPQTASPFTGLLGNPQVEFRLAQRDPNGNCTNGIEHIYTQATYAGDDNSKLDPWPPDQYLNVWLEKSIDKDTTEYGILAYAYYPPSVSTYSDDRVIDGIIAKDFCVGGNVDFSRPTLGHECGHWMNLEHPWGNTNSPGVACGDDGVNDTPETLGDANTYPGDPDPITEARCVPGVIENVQNIMNYAEQHFMFTQGQVDRMHAALNSSVAGRDSIWSPDNLIATGTDQPLVYPNPNSCAAPIAEFGVNERYICTGQNVQFQDLSYNAIYQNRQWTFPSDAVVSSTTDPKPIVSFNNPGWKQVTLVVSNSNGSSTKVKTMVYVSDGNLVTAPYVETFEDTNEVNTNWIVLNYDFNNTWFHWANIGHYSSGSYMLNMYNVLYDGDVDELVSPQLDLSGLTYGQNNTISFQYSFATFDATHVDDSVAAIQLLASADCGATWKALYFNAGGYNLYNGGAWTTGAYVPGEGDQFWKQVTVTIPNDLLVTGVNFKLQTFSAYQANQFYVDNINVGQSATTGISSVQVSKVSALHIIPNPATGAATIVLDASAAANVSVSLYDMTGREITTLYQGPADAGAKTIAFDTDDIASGIYIVKVADGLSTMQRRFVKL